MEKDGIENIFLLLSDLIIRRVTFRMIACHNVTSHVDKFERNGKRCQAHTRRFFGDIFSCDYSALFVQIFDRLEDGSKKEEEKKTRRVWRRKEASRVKSINKSFSLWLKKRKDWERGWDSIKVKTP